MTENTEFGGWLADYRHHRLRMACAPCGRQGDYRVATLRTMLGNPPMDEVPRLLAIKGGCPLAARFPGRDCRASFLSRNVPAAVQDLASARGAGLQLVLICERHRQGLKSVKPCRQPFYIDLQSLIAALGHDFPLANLRKRLICPGCGSDRFSLTWIPPKTPSAELFPFPKVG